MRWTSALAPRSAMKNRADGFSLVEVLVAISISRRRPCVARAACAARAQERSVRGAPDGRRCPRAGQDGTASRGAMADQRRAPAAASSSTPHGASARRRHDRADRNRIRAAWSVDPVPAHPRRRVALHVWVAPRGAGDGTARQRPRAEDQLMPRHRRRRLLARRARRRARPHPGRDRGDLRSGRTLAAPFRCRARRRRPAAAYPRGRRCALSRPADGKRADCRIARRVRRRIRPARSKTMW